MDLDIKVIGNRLEAGLWLLIATILLCHIGSRLLHHATVPGFVSIAAFAFAVFGLSDIIESFTGAWWTPWWLFAMKASCVLAFVHCFREFRRSKIQRINSATGLVEPTETPVQKLT